MSTAPSSSPTAAGRPAERFKVMKIGWIGLGQIGTPMALRSAAAGHAVTAHVRRPRPELADSGLMLSTHLGQVLADKDVVCVNVFDDAQLKAIFFESNALSRMQDGALLIVHTTGSPSLAREIHRAAKGLGIEAVDATFSGNAGHTSRGELTVMIGGDEAGFRRASELVSAYANHVYHAGPPGSGQLLKLINNALFAAQVALGAAAIRAATSAGLAPQTTKQALARSSGQSFALDMMIPHEPLEPFLHALRRYLDKDVATAAAAAADAGLDISALLKVAGTSDEPSFARTLP
jgi:3-hydroxyisobutyrate dehydrogenase-like beta-hydroxyacid dehydrogenase